jgi:diadenosine tetraphosphate (Ap4A) HIT family hydrolase
MTICEFLEGHELYGDLIGDSDYWKLFLAPSQRYLGTCVLVLKRNVSDLKCLKSEEWGEFGILVKNIEESLGNTLNPDLFNWSCFKNAAFREDNPKPQIHWHVQPRYKNPPFFDGIKFEDPDFGHLPKAINREIPNSVQKNLLNLIKNDLNINCDNNII